MKTLNLLRILMVVSLVIGGICLFSGPARADTTSILEAADKALQTAQDALATGSRTDIAIATSQIEVAQLDINKILQNIPPELAKAVSELRDTNKLLESIQVELAARRVGQIVIADATGKIEIAQDSFEDMLKTLVAKEVVRQGGEVGTGGTGTGGFTDGRQYASRDSNPDHYGDDPEHHCDQGPNCKDPTHHHEYCSDGNCQYRHHHDDDGGCNPPPPASNPCPHDGDHHDGDQYGGGSDDGHYQCQLEPQKCDTSYGQPG